MESSSPRSLLVGLAVPEAPPDVTPHVEALRQAVEEIVVPALGQDLRWGTTVVTPGDDLERGTGSQARGRAWDRLLGAARELESGGIRGQRLDRDPAAMPPDLSVTPVHAVARLLPGRPGTLAWSVQEWAVADWPALVQAAQAWLLATAERLGAGSGFVTLDLVEAVEPSSAWEIVAGVAPADRDFVARLWGYGWGTLLTAAQAERVGGTERLGTLPGARLLVGPGGLVWLTLGDDPRAADPVRVSALREALTPLLPPGLRTVEEYFAPSDDPYRSPPTPYLV